MNAGESRETGTGWWQLITCMWICVWTHTHRDCKAKKKTQASGGRGSSSVGGKFMFWISWSMLAFQLQSHCEGKCIVQTMVFTWLLYKIRTRVVRLFRKCVVVERITTPVVPWYPDSRSFTIVSNEVSLLDDVSADDVGYPSSVESLLHQVECPLILDQQTLSQWQHKLVQWWECSSCRESLWRRHRQDLKYFFAVHHGHW